MPGRRNAIVLVKRQYMPRIEAASALPLAKDGGFVSRPGSQVSGIANLYLAGDWVGPEGFLVDASMASARQVAQLLLQGDLAALQAKSSMVSEERAQHGGVRAACLYQSPQLHSVDPAFASSHRSKSPS
jgi:hypothetical protein